MPYCEEKVVVELNLFLWGQVPRRCTSALSRLYSTGDTAGQLTQALPGRQECGDGDLREAPEHPSARSSCWYFGRM